MDTLETTSATVIIPDLTTSRCWIGCTAGRSATMAAADRRLRLVVVLDLPSDLSPRELRERFVTALRAAVMRARARGLQTEVAEELWRATPGLEARR
jgi:hypothetical protein